MASKKTTLILAATAAVAVAALGFGVMRGGETSTEKHLVVYKTPTCGCCAKWVDHMKAAGYDVEVHDVDDLSAIKHAKHVPVGARSCHTAVVGGYTIEGHVPASYVDKLLAEKPEITGVAVPGMPMGSPGMEGAYRDSYDILAFNEAGRTAVYGHVEGDPGR